MNRKPDFCPNLNFLKANIYSNLRFKSKLYGVCFKVVSLCSVEVTTLHF